MRNIHSELSSVGHLTSYILYVFKHAHTKCARWELSVVEQGYRAALEVLVRPASAGRPVVQLTRHHSAAFPAFGHRTVLLAARRNDQLPAAAAARAAAVRRACTRPVAHAACPVHTSAASRRHEPISTSSSWLASRPIRPATARIPVVLYWDSPFSPVRSRRAERRLLPRFLSSGECAAKFSDP
jgi:hypothetical protein